jgi:hypothetical protein
MSEASEEQIAARRERIRRAGRGSQQVRRVTRAVLAAVVVLGSATLIDVQQPFHLRQQAVQQPEVAPSDPDHGRDHLLVERCASGSSTPSGVQRASSRRRISVAFKGRNSWTKPILELTCR